MTRRTFAATGLASLAPAQRSSDRKPNSIVILLDDLGCTDLGCYGAKDLRTPNIDALAESGVRFTNWYSNASVCAPARASLMTGRYPAHAGVPTNGGKLSLDQPILPALLRTAGYKTGLVGKWHLGMSNDAAPNDRGFDEFYGFHPGCVDFYSHRFYWGEPRVANYHDLFRNKTEIWEDGQYLTERIGQEAVSFIERHKDGPFFLYAAFNAPHYPMHAPGKYMERFRDLPLERRIYAAMVSAVDDAIGLITAALNRLGIADNTCIVFAGDNGATTERRASLDGLAPATAGSNGPYRGFKFSLFDGGMHVPGIMTWPGVLPSGEVRDQVVMTMDLLPTLCRAAGVSIPAGKEPDGTDIMPVAESGAPSPHRPIFWTQGPQLAVRRGQWKLVINGRTYDGTEDGNKHLTGEDAMFLSDLTQDPGEGTNLRRKHPEMVDELATLAHKWKAEQSD
jgi:arylsulfatase A-like enzyme